LSISPTLSIQSNPPKHQDRPLHGIFWKLLSYALFATVNAVVRYLSGGASFHPPMPLPIPVILFFQNMFALIFILPVILQCSIQELKPKQPWWHLLRITGALLGILFWNLALSHVPLTEAIALSFVSHIFTILGAWLFLKEQLTARRVIAIVLSIIGSFIITNPHLKLGHLGIASIGLLYLLGSDLFFSVSKLTGRKLGMMGESPKVLTIYLLLLLPPVFFALALPAWQTPSMAHWGWLMLIGLLSALANYSLIQAYVLAEVTFLMPFSFVKLLFNVLLGYWIFAEIPSNWQTWAGIAIILFSISILIRKRKASPSFKAVTA
jgi:drug/metabolite transporter (DMT)-like permease